MKKKIIITKDKVHKPCWKCAMPFFRYRHYSKLDDNGFVGQNLVVDGEECLVVNKEDIFYEEDLEIKPIGEKLQI